MTQCSGTLPGPRTQVSWLGSWRGVPAWAPACRRALAYVWTGVAVLFLCLALAVPVFSSVCPCFLRAHAVGASVCVSASAQASFRATPILFFVEMFVSRGPALSRTVAVCAHVSGRRHPLELSPPPK